MEKASGELICYKIKKFEYREKSFTTIGQVNLPPYLIYAAEGYLRIKKKHKLGGKSTGLIPRLAADFL